MATKHIHRLPVSPRSLLISEKMKCSGHIKCGATYDYFTGKWQAKKKIKA